MVLLKLSDIQKVLMNTIDRFIKITEEFVYPKIVLSFICHFKITFRPLKT